jgi:hypothetical protein
VYISPDINPLDEYRKGGPVTEAFTTAMKLPYTRFKLPMVMKDIWEGLDYDDLEWVAVVLRNYDEETPGKLPKKVHALIGAILAHIPLS